MKWALVPLLLACLCGQPLPTGPQVVSFTSSVDGSDQPYALYVPKGLDRTRKYPLVISLHTEGSTHRFSLQQVFGKENLEGRRYPASNRYFPPLPDVQAFVAAPFARGTLGYQGIAEADVYDVLNDVEKRFPIDEDRVYLTGAAMGGGGALWLGLTRPDLWAAIAAVCPEPPPETESLAANALNLPIRLFHGEADPLVPAANSRRWRQELARLGSPVEYTEYPRAGHPAWTFAYRDAAIFDWFAKFQRNRFPDRVRLTADRYRYAKAYWVRLDGIEPGALASLDVRFSGPNRLTASTNRLSGFTLMPAGHPLYAKAKPLAIVIDGQTINAGPSAALSFLKTPQGWRAGSYAAAPDQKRAGLEGPIAEAFASRQIYVYGTGGSPKLDELTARREQARRAATWSTVRNPASITFRVAADLELRPRDLGSESLILFGTKETNQWIARFADRLPIALNPSAADYGLIFLYPAEGRYIVVNSGLPWWTGGEVARRPGLAFLAPDYRLLLSFPDYVLFKGSLENIVAQGYFTNDWKVPAADLDKMRLTGAIAAK